MIFRNEDLARLATGIVGGHRMRPEPKLRARSHKTPVRQHHLMNRAFVLRSGEEVSGRCRFGRSIGH